MRVKLKISYITINDKEEKKYRQTFPRSVLFCYGWGKEKDKVQIEFTLMLTYSSDIQVDHNK